MNFDKIIMNPPYNGSLHLKILEQVTSLLKEDGVCINLSPIRWLQDPLVEYKKNTDWEKYKDLRQHINSLTVIKTEEARDLFKIELLQPLGIYIITSQIKDIFHHDEFFQKIFRKIIKDNIYDTLNIVKYSDHLDNYICLNTLAPPMKYGRPMFRWLKDTGVLTKTNNYLKWKNSIKSATRGDEKNTLCVVFNTEQEALNCLNTMDNTLAKYLCMKSVVDVHVYPKFAPWMPDYSHPWTNKMMYEYFNINEQEQKEIEETMKHYM